jgi:hypothetical protein
MSSLAERIVPVGESTGTAYLWWIPLAGAFWVAANAALVGLGAQIACPIRCAFVAGILDGMILSVIAVAKASARFQASVTGLLGGISLSGLRNDGSMIWKAVHAVHNFVDNCIVGRVPDPDKFHQDVEQEVLYIIWTAIFVVMASLVVEWVRATRDES